MGTKASIDDCIVSAAINCPRERWNNKVHFDVKGSRPGLVLNFLFANPDSGLVRATAQ